MPNMRLITIPISHYCEKARWGMERLGLEYQEERHLQGFHYPRTLWLSHNPNVPVLIDNSQVIADSTAILKHLDRYAPGSARLYPETTAARQRVEELEDLFDETLGVESRRWFYFHFLPNANEAISFASQGVPDIERSIALWAFPLMRRYALWLLMVSDHTVKAGLVRAYKIVQKTDVLLADGRPFLVDDAFSAADLTLACMMVPFVLPEEYGVRLPRPEDLPAAMQSTVQAFRETTTGQYVLKLFHTHRHCTARSDHTFPPQPAKEAA